MCVLSISLFCIHLSNKYSSIYVLFRGGSKTEDKGGVPSSSSKKRPQFRRDLHDYSTISCSLFSITALTHVFISSFVFINTSLEVYIFIQSCNCKCVYYRYS